MGGVVYLQTRVQGSKSENDFGSVMGETDDGATATAREATPDTGKRATAPPLEEKVPL